MDETRRRSGCDHPLACALVLSAVRRIGGAGTGPSLAVFGWLAVAALATMGVAGEVQPSSAGVKAVLGFGREAASGETQPAEEAVFVIGDPISLTVTVRNETDARWSVSLGGLRNDPTAYVVTDLATGRALRSIHGRGHYAPGQAVKRTPIEPRGEASFRLADLLAMYPHVRDAGAVALWLAAGTLWSPGAAYSVRVVIPSLTNLDGGGASVWPDALESNVLRFRVTGMGKEDVPRILHAARTGPWESRVRAIKALEVANATPAATELVSLALHDESYRVRRAALYALGRIVPKTFRASVFEKAAQADPDPRVRKVAVGFFGDRRGKRSIRLLKKISRKDPDARVRRAAEFVIERIKSDPAGVRE